MMEFYVFLILGLATWRISFMLVNEEGPYRIFVHLREWAGIKLWDEATADEQFQWLQLYGDSDESPYIAVTMFGLLLLCIWCTSVWVGIALYISYLLLPALTMVLSVPLALSSFAILFENKREN